MSQQLLDSPEQNLGPRPADGGRLLIVLPDSDFGYHVPLTDYEQSSFSKQGFDKSAIIGLTPSEFIIVGERNVRDSKNATRLTKIISWLRVKATGASMYTKAGVGLGGALGGVYATGAEVVHADYPCDYGADYSVQDPRGPQYPDIDMCYGDPPTTTEKPTNTTVKPTQTTQSGGGGNNGGGSGGGNGSTPTQTTSPFAEVNNDNDAWTIVVDKKTGEKQSGWDVNDYSEGLGQVGVDQYIAELSLRGLELDPKYNNDSAKLVAMTVNPADWGAYFGDMLAVPATTTTTTISSESLPVETDPEETFAEEVIVDDTVGAPKPDKNPAVAPAETPEESSDSTAQVLGVVGGVLGLGGLLALLRLRGRRVKPAKANNKPKTPTGGGLSWPGGAVGASGGGN
jgi:hypothetical protein